MGKHTERAQQAAARLRQDVEDNVLRTPCPACGAEAGAKCVTVMDGVDKGWHHDARFYVANGWAHADARTKGVSR